jgi:hypothetical protein
MFTISTVQLAFPDGWHPWNGYGVWFIAFGDPHVVLLQADFVVILCSYLVPKATLRRARSSGNVLHWELTHSTARFTTTMLSLTYALTLWSAGFIASGSCSRWNSKHQSCLGDGDIIAHTGTPVGKEEVHNGGKMSIEKQVEARRC